MDTGAWWSIAAGVLAIVVWAVRIEGKVLLNERLHSDLRDDVSEIKSDVRQIRDRVIGRAQ